MSSQQLNPIKYIESLDIRFSDLDMYGHVNAKHYLDLISTSRLIFLADKMKKPIEEVTKEGIGFFMTKSTVNYKRPINGLQSVVCSSFVQEIRDEKILIIPFSISAERDQKVFADGVLEFAIIDMSTKRPTGAPAWLLDLFFEK